MEYLLVLYLSIGTLVYTVPIDKTCNELYEAMEIKNIIQYVNIYDDSGKMAKYQGREVKLNKPSRGDVKKFKVFVKDKKTGNVKKVNFGSKEMSIKKNIPARKRSFDARMGGVLKRVKGQKNLSAAYWSLQAWKKGFKV